MNGFMFYFLKNMQKSYCWIYRKFNAHSWIAIHSQIANELWTNKRKKKNESSKISPNIQQACNRKGKTKKKKQINENFDNFNVTMQIYWIKLEAFVREKKKNKINNSKLGMFAKFAFSDFLGGNDVCSVRDFHSRSFYSLMRKTGLNNGIFNGKLFNNYYYAIFAKKHLAGKWIQWDQHKYFNIDILYPNH